MFYTCTDFLDFEEWLTWVSESQYICRLLQIDEVLVILWRSGRIFQLPIIKYVLHMHWFLGFWGVTDMSVWVTVYMSFTADIYSTMHAATNYCWIVMAHFWWGFKWSSFEEVDQLPIIKYVLHTDFLDSEEWLTWVSESQYICRLLQTF